MKSQRLCLKQEIEELQELIIEAQNKALISELWAYKDSKKVSYVYEICGGMGSLSVKVYGKRKVFEVFAYDILRPCGKWAAGHKLFRELQEIVCYYQNLNSHYSPATI